AFRVPRQVEEHIVFGEAQLTFGKLGPQLAHDSDLRAKQRLPGVDCCGLVTHSGASAPNSMRWLPVKRIEGPSQRLSDGPSPCTKSVLQSTSAEAATANNFR